MVTEIWQQRALAERGLILLILREASGCMDIATLRGVMDSLGYPTERQHVMRHCEYLAEKGFLHIEKLKSVGLKVTMYRLTADGRDVLLGVTQCAGVVIPDIESD